jgi:hypothetical protein
MSLPIKAPAPRQISSMQIVFGSILAISLLLAINFSGRIAAGRRIDSEHDGLDKVISTLQSEATALKATLSYVNSDTFISRWAHNEGKMVKEGEVLVIPVPGPMTPEPSPTPLVIAPSNNPRTETDNWKLWWQLFFDSPPPDDGN